MVKVGSTVEIVYTGTVTYHVGDRLEVDSYMGFDLSDSGLQVTLLAEPLPDTGGTVIKNVRTEDGCYIPYAVLVYDRWYGLCKPDGIATSVHGDDITEWEPIEDED